MDRVEKKMAKKVGAALRKALGLKYDVTLVSRSANVRMYDILLADTKKGIYFLYRVLEKSVVTLNISNKDVETSKKNVKVLYDFFIA